jgi:D-alanyl-D-alanine carboxypeptidase/D-alanyl-D-alanine-endopeptidase (penicillin-binding protein 4)
MATTGFAMGPRGMADRACMLALSATLFLARCHGGTTIAEGDGPALSTASASPATAPAPSALGTLAAAQESPPAAAVSASAPSLREAVIALSTRISALGGQLGAAIVDVGTGELLAAHDEHRLQNPASNAKLFTAAAALSLLHANYRFETGLYGEQHGTSASNVVLRGHGDPSFVSTDLWDMVRDLRERGVRRIDGDVLVDQRFFDDAFVPPAFEQQPGEWAKFRAPVSAVALNENTVRMSVRPATVDAPALVAFDPPGFVDTEGVVKTVAQGHPQDVRLELSPLNGRLLARIGGAVPVGDPELEFTRRVDNPALLAGYALRAMLQSAGVTVSGEVRAGGESARSALVIHRSKPLSSLLYELGKTSDNFYAEMVLKTLGAERAGRPGRSGDGAEVVTKFLKGAGVFDEGMVIKNGSGLYDANRVTASATARLLRAAYRDPAISAEYVAQLAIGGVDGTLHKRFQELRESRAVRAKTGTLEATAALSGYVLAPAGRSPIAFSIIVNDVAGKVSAAREAIDQCTLAIAKHLFRDARTEARRRN